MSYLLPAPGTREYRHVFLTDAERWAIRARQHKRTHPACAATGLPTEESHHRFGRGLVSPIGSESDDELVPLAEFVHHKVTSAQRAYGKQRGWTNGRMQPLGQGETLRRNRENFQLIAIPRVTRRVVWAVRLRLSVWFTALNLVAAGWFAVTVGLWVPILAAAATVIAGPVRRKVAR